MLRLFVEAILLVLVNALNICGLLIRFFPHIIKVARDLAQWFVAASVFVYRLILVRLAPFAAGVRIDLLGSAWRLVATTVLSVALGTGIVYVIGWPVSLIALVISVVHGLLIGIVWDNLGPPNSGLTLGV